MYSSTAVYLTLLTVVHHFVISVTQQMFTNMFFILLQIQMICWANQNFFLRSASYQASHYASCVS